jgi:S1-C subfamily serine protease
MNGLVRSHVASAIVGGLVVAGVLLAVGVIGRRTTQTIVEESPVGAKPASERSAQLTPHGIYVRDAPGVVFVKAQLVKTVEDPFEMFPERQQTTSTGSGFLVDRRGDILTSYHVIEGADHYHGVTVEFADNISRPAVVVGQDPNDDLAVLRVDMDNVPRVDPLTLGDSATVRVGDPTLAIGNPFGYDRTLTSGIVSALQRQIKAPDGFSIDNVIQTDAPINPGNSGGPLLDADGRVIGINSQIATASDNGAANVGIAFAVPIDTAKGALEPLEAGRPVRVAWLGVGAGRTTASAGSGAAITVDPGGPAAQAGLRKGDVIESIGGRAVTSLSQLERIVSADSPGQAVAVLARRGARRLAFDVTLGAKPAR